MRRALIALGAVGVGFALVWFAFAEEPASKIATALAPIAVLPPPGVVGPPPRTPALDPLAVRLDAGPLPSASPAAVEQVGDLGSPTRELGEASVALSAWLAADAGLPASPPAAATPDDPVAPERSDGRFTVRWDKPALCLDGKDRAATLAGRARLLQTFAVWNGGWIIHHHPSIEVATVRQIGEALTRGHGNALGLLGSQVASIRAPDVYVYENLEQLLDNACVNKAARGYYDGAIHLTGDWDVAQSAIHEYLHHALLSLGVKKPMWFHEGLAMLAADETWWKDGRLGLREWIVKGHLPFEALTDAFPHSSDAKFAVAVYYQSVLMVEFLRERNGGSDFRAFVEGLASGQIPARKAFAQNVRLDGEALDAAFQAFVAQQ